MNTEENFNETDFYTFLVHDISYKYIKLNRKSIFYWSIEKLTFSFFIHELRERLNKIKNK